MKKIYVLDTNVLINDPKAFLSFKKNDTVVIPYKVIEELEKHKLASGDLGAAARSCSRSLMYAIQEGQKTLKSGIKLDNGTILRVVPSQDFKHEEALGALRSGDDHILAVATGLTHAEEGENSKVVMVSEDMLLKIRANSFDIPVESHGERTKTSLEEIYPGYRHIHVSDEVLSSYWQEYQANYEDMFSFLPKELTKEKLHTNEFIILSSPKRPCKKPYPLLRCVEKPQKLRFAKEQVLEKIQPLNVEQAMAVELLMDPKVQLVSLMGQAGTGKTLLSIEAGLNQVIGGKKRYKNLLILRPVHPVGKDIGYLPGDKSEKLEPWIAPIKDNLRFLLGNSKAKSRRVDNNLEMLFERGTIEIEAMAYIRGRSINDAFILVDESQNLNKHELKTILTRVGKGTKVVLTGDIEQTDRSDIGAFTNGLSVAVEKFKKYGISGHVTLREGVRSELSALAAKIL